MLKDHDSLSQKKKSPSKMSEGYARSNKGSVESVPMSTSLSSTSSRRRTLPSKTKVVFQAYDVSPKQRARGSLQVVLFAVRTSKSTSSSFDAMILCLALEFGSGTQVF